MVGTRREFLAVTLGSARLLAPFARGPEQQADPVAARFLGTLRLSGRDDGAAPTGTLIGSGLDARLVDDLSTLTPETLVTPNERFFVRTACPTTLPWTERWQIQIGGLVESPQRIALDALRDLVRPSGTHLIECSGNRDPSNYGLMSAARWDGLPVAALLDRVKAGRRAARVLVIGVDEAAAGSGTSTPGASWIFSRDDLDRAGAFFATSMNGAPLPRDHGFPVRLVVPGWVRLRLHQMGKSNRPGLR